MSRVLQTLHTYYIQYVAATCVMVYVQFMLRSRTFMKVNQRRQFDFQRCRRLE